MNFGGLGIGSKIFILDRGDKASCLGQELYVGEIIDKTAPHFNMQGGGNSVMTEQVVDFKVRIGDEEKPLSNLVCTSECATYNNGRQFVCTDREQVLRENERMMAASRIELDSRGYYERVLENGERIKERLDEDYAHKKSQDAIVTNLQNRVDDMSVKFDTMMQLMNDIKKSLSDNK